MVPDDEFWEWIEEVASKSVGAVISIPMSTYGEFAVAFLQYLAQLSEQAGLDPDHELRFTIHQIELDRKGGEPS